MIFLVFGSQPTLSLAEVAAVFGKGHDYSRSSQAGLLIQHPMSSAEELLDKLGGTSKAGIVLREYANWDMESVYTLLLDAIQKKSTRHVEPNKISFGISVYDGGNPSLAGVLKKNVKKLGLQLKKELRALERPVRFVTSKEPDLSSVVVDTNGLLVSGGEYVLFATPEGVVVGKTEAVQNFRDWSERDYGRPARDAESGMLPPKLARMMINLSGRNPYATVLLDPFCGSGTILMEAALVGYRQVICNDLSEKAIVDSKTNWTWLQDRYAAVRDTDLRLIEGPAEDLPKKIDYPIDLVVTETYLGPPQTGKESSQNLDRIEQELVTLYRDSLRSLRSLLKEDGKIVMAFPAFQQNGKMRFLPLQELLGEVGFRVQHPLPNNIPSTLRRVTPAGGILYAREGQHVVREILVLKPE